MQKDYLELLTKLIDLDIELDLLDGETFFKLQDLQTNLENNK